MEQRITNGTCEYGGPRIIPFFTGYANPCNHLFVNTGYTHHTMFVRISICLLYTSRCVYETGIPLLFHKFVS